MLREVVAEAGLTERNLRATLVVNPSHTASLLPALADKRAWLSRDGLLIHTANTYSSGWTKTKNGNIPGKASDTAATAWVRGKKLTDFLKEEERQSALENGYALKTFVWSPSANLSPKETAAARLVTPGLAQP